MATLRVLIVDDEDDMRALLRNLIELANEGLAVAGEAADGDEALALWRREQPEIVLLDQRMPGLSGLETAERMLREDPATKVILFTAYLDEAITAAANRLGVRRCVSKGDAKRLVERLRECAAA
jgi:YesN/AraC family two-component response regulator